MQISSRPYRDERDLQALLAFATEVAGLAPEISYFHIGDVLWGMFQNVVFDPQQGTQLWENEDGELLGFNWVSPPGVVFWDIHPRLRNTGLLEEPMLKWSEQHGSVTLKEGDNAGKRQVWIRTSDADPQSMAFFEQRGYELDTDFMYHMRRNLADPIPDVPLPEGFAVRHVGDEDEWHERVETHREVWNPSKVTLEAYRRLRQAPGYIPELDIVLVAPDGHFAAYCICWLDPVNHTGEFEPVGTRPAYQGKGLGKIVIAEGLRRLKAHGAHTAIVFAESGNPAAQKLYQAAGFRAVNRDLFYTKVL
ncbi:MAG: GNAT family N-acetyltransferase [Chloroflexi bacterium]|nr:GNAT family N-acetyltransferase [Chloroflexota bacterium]